MFPAARGGYLSLDNLRTREWYDALDAAGIARRGPYHLRHTFATEALAAGVSIFELARVMGASVKEIDRTYGHLARDSEDAIRARLEARAARSGVDLASAEPERTEPELAKTAAVQAIRETGATGLEPATSGVTGMFHRYDDWRRLTRYRSIHAGLRAFRADLRTIE